MSQVSPQPRSALSNVEIILANRIGQFTVRVMATAAQSPTMLSSTSDPQTPVADMVMGRINTFMREKAQLIDKLADAKLNCERLERKQNVARVEFQAKIKNLEDIIEQLRGENEQVNPLNVCIIFD